MAVLPLVTLGPKRTTELYNCWIEVLAKPALGHGTDTSRLKELTGMGSTDNQSLLATIHNWTYHSQPREERPAEAAPWERNTVYAFGALMTIATIGLMGWRRKDSPHELLLITGLLVGIALIVSPVTHNFYYLLMLPPVTALIDLGLPQGSGSKLNWKLLLPVVVFMLGDLLARLPGIGRILRDNGITTVSLLWLLATGAVFLASRAKLYRTSVAK